MSTPRDSDRNAEERSAEEKKRVILDTNRGTLADRVDTSESDNQEVKAAEANREHLFIARIEQYKIAKTVTWFIAAAASIILIALAIASSILPFFVTDSNIYSRFVDFATILAYGSIGILAIILMCVLVNGGEIMEAISMLVSRFVKWKGKK